MIKRVYIDTSVIGGQFDKEFSLDTIPFFESVIKGQIIILVSDLLEAELIRAPGQVKDFLKIIPEKSIEKLQLSEEAADLAKIGILKQKWLEKRAGPIVNILRWRQ